ncbi:hypothetical protein R3P38DRAFT_2882282 [Favolaschia claudopus]|uniref:NAD(P)-binding protein n=1 Tax=Favolaschia claudopus TaxID=2862362 RepID=A0AAW0D1C3_9AGAR
MRRGIWAFIQDQWTTQPPVLQKDLNGQTVIVLGASTGLGFEAAKHFASMKPGRLILCCRSQSRGQTALEKIIEATGCAVAELWIIDLGDFTSVGQFITKFEQDGGRLDILVANAAVYADKYEPTNDGWETAFQISNLSSPLVILRLLPIMLRTAREYSTSPRLVVVSSETHYFYTPNKKLQEDPELLATVGSAEYCSPTNMMFRYVLTKLLNILFVRALTARLPPSTPIIVNSVNPGLCHSELTRTMTGILAFFDRLTNWIFAYSTEVGSRHLVWAALADATEVQPESLRGAYIHGQKVTEPSDFVISVEGEKMQNRIWDELISILAKVDPRVTETVNECLAPDPPTAPGL